MLGTRPSFYWRSHPPLCRPFRDHQAPSPACLTAACPPQQAAAPRRPLARPAVFSAEFVAGPVLAPDPEDSVAPKYRDLTLQQLEQAFRAEHPGLLEALAGAAAEATPATAAKLLRRLEAELPPALTDVVPGGDCVLVALVPAGLLPLLERCTDCCDASLAARSHTQAARTATVALSLLSCLAFAGGFSAARYAAVAARCRQALKAAYDAEALVRQEDIVELYAACARSSPWLWLAPWCGHRAKAATEAFIAGGWDTAELAVRFAESYARLLGRGRLVQVESKVVAAMRAALAHPLSLAQAERLLAAKDCLPVELSISLALHARSHPAADWHSQLLARHACLSEQQQQLEAAAAAGLAAAQPQQAPAPLLCHRRQLVPAHALQRLAQDM